MADAKANLKCLLAPCFGLVYSEGAAERAVGLYLSSMKELRLYIIGCLLLTLTASVLPQFTLLADRLQTLTVASGCAAAAARSIAEAGFFCQRTGSGGGDGRGSIVCFHCCVRLPPGTVGADPLGLHRSASPNCYYARLAELTRAGAPAADRLGVVDDALRYEKALRKLRADLAAGGLAVAAAFGFDAGRLAVWATRQFMRCNVVCPTRAGDLIQLAHDSEGLFPAQLLEAVNVCGLLDLLDLGQQRLH